MGQRRSMAKVSQYRRWRDRHAAQQKWCCAYCSVKMKKGVKDGPRPDNTLSADHIVAISTFGVNSFYNIVACCERCNMEKADKFLTISQMVSLVKIKRSMSIKIISSILVSFLTFGVYYDTLYKINNFKIA